MTHWKTQGVLDISGIGIATNYNFFRIVDLETKEEIGFITYKQFMSIKDKLEEIPEELIMWCRSYKVKEA